MLQKKIILPGLAVLLLVAGGWLYNQRVRRVAMESYVPESALGYIEVNDLPRLLDGFTSTAAWQKLAPAYGLPERLNYLGKVGTLARWTGIGPLESVVLARTQIAVAVTGIEVRGEEVKPRLAIIAETHTSESRLHSVVEDRLPQLAARAYGQPIREATEYLGVPITIFRAPEGERRLLSAQIGSLWIVANHPDSLRACIETRLGRSPSMAHGNFFLKTARPLVAGKANEESDLFAFVSGQGMMRMMQFATNLVAGRVTNNTPFAGALEGLLAELSSRMVDAAAYGASFERGVVVNRYALLFKPAVVDKLKDSIKAGDNGKSGGELRALKLVPASVREITIVNVENPISALDHFEAAIASQLGTGQSFMLHRVFLSGREALLGLKPNENSAPAFGNEIATLSFSESGSDRVLLIAARDRARLQQFAEKFLGSGGATIRREKYHDVELMIPSNERRGVGAFIGDFLALGARDKVMRVIDTQQRGELLTATPQFAAAQPPSQPVPIISYSSVKDETGEMMAALARRLNGKADHKTADAQSALNEIPLAVSATSLNDHGLYIESTAPLGNFPLLISLIDDSSAN
ncbi:MAG TPA: hypothetical protein VFD58_26370 [Blastocatellia bacterium]|nr:hypothetical protein [Blastocatellia bacterium]